MSEKQTLSYGFNAPNRPVAREPISAVERWSRRALAILVPICLLLALTGHRPTFPWIRPSWWQEGQQQQQQHTVHEVIPVENKVLLEAHIMSKCPDARDCLRDLVIPTMAQMADKVEFTLSFIGTPVDKGFGVECMHGPGECLGDVIELCAASEYPDPKIYLGFTWCLTDKYQQIPQEELIKACSLEHSIDFNVLNECASRDDGAHAHDLLTDSVARSAHANVTKSCTVRLNNEIRCVRDGGQWKDCPGGHEVSDLVADINSIVNP